MADRWSVRSLTMLADLFSPIPYMFDYQRSQWQNCKTCHCYLLVVRIVDICKWPLLKQVIFGLTDCGWIGLKCFSRGKHIGHSLCWQIFFYLPSRMPLNLKKQTLVIAGPVGHWSVTTCSVISGLNCEKPVVKIGRSIHITVGKPPPWKDIWIWL